METDVAVISRICGRIKPFCVMSTRAATIYSNIRFICEYDLMIHIRYSPCLYSNTGEYIFSRQLYGLKSSISLYNGP